MVPLAIFQSVFILTHFSIQWNYGWSILETPSTPKQLANSSSIHASLHFSSSTFKIVSFTNVTYNFLWNTILVWEKNPTTLGPPGIFSCHVYGLPKRMFSFTEPRIKWGLDAFRGRFTPSVTPFGVAKHRTAARKRPHGLELSLLPLQEREEGGDLVERFRICMYSKYVIFICFIKT